MLIDAAVQIERFVQPFCAMSLLRSSDVVSHDRHRVMRWHRQVPIDDPSGVQHVQRKFLATQPMQELHAALWPHIENAARGRANNRKVFFD